MAQERVRHRWWVIGLVTFAGVVITAAPFALAWRRGEDVFGSYEALTSSALTNIGTALLLVALVYFAERGFAARVSAAAGRAAKAQVDESTQDLRTRQDELALQLTSLQDAFADRTKVRAAQFDATFDDLESRPSFETVTAVLEEANSFGALRHSSITVPLNEDEYTHQIEFTWEPSSRHWTDTGEPELTLRYPVGERTFNSVIWQHNWTAVDLMEELHRQLIANGRADMAKNVPSDLLLNLGTALRDAIAGQRQDDGAWSQGPMSEWLRDGWALTSFGIVSRDHGLVLTGADLPSPEAMPARNKPARVWSAPAAPPGVDGKFWAFAVKRARLDIPSGSDGSSSAAVWAASGVSAAYTKETSPLRTVRQR